VTRSPLFWVVVFLICTLMEGTALYYQYVLEYDPCVLCVQIRGCILLIMIASVIGIFGASWKPSRLIAHLLGLFGSGLFLERSYQTLGVEKGFIEGSCTLSGGFPNWIPLNELWPAVFEPLELCGYTPLLPMGISMAEALIVVSGIFVLIFLLSLPSTLKRTKTNLFL
jgi:disulfide bond formation protein DsbB